MQANSIYRAIAYLIVAAGLGISLLTSVVPQYAMAHHLLFSAFLITAAPYVIYAAFVPFMRGPLLVVPGLILLGLQLLRQVPAWLALQNPAVPQAYYDSVLNGLVVTLPLMIIITWWSVRQSSRPGGTVASL